MHLRASSSRGGDAELGVVTPGTGLEPATPSAHQASASPDASGVLKAPRSPVPVLGIVCDPKEAWRPTLGTSEGASRPLPGPYAHCLSSKVSLTACSPVAVPQDSRAYVFSPGRAGGALPHGVADQVVQGQESNGPPGLQASARVQDRVQGP
uniref:Uncharacterized protein n=1 Tax=Peronospora matthiolae TaxID=2874970 RepID=A0AAV1T720_9STRA